VSSARFGWLVSYPRSGSTWLRLLLESLGRGGQPVTLNARTLQTPVASRWEFDAALGTESALLRDNEIDDALPGFYSALASSSSTPLILRKVHDRCRKTTGGQPVFPPALSRGAIYLARDPRDVAVSSAAFFDITLDDAIARMNDTGQTLSDPRMGPSVQLPQPLGSWSQHVTGWLDDSAMPLQIVRYEDLLTDAGRELAKIAHLFDLPATSATQAALATTFSNLQAQENRAGFCENLQHGKRFFRRGMAGAWRQMLTPSQTDRIRRDHGASMSRLGYN
jgi:aryl sulfotransferase